MSRERMRQIGVDALDAVLTSAPAVFYGFYLLTKPDDDTTVYAGLIAVTTSLAVKSIPIVIRSPILWVYAEDEAEAKSMDNNKAKKEFVYWPEPDRGTATPARAATGRDSTQ